MTHDNKLVDFHVEQELKQRLQQDAQTFDAPLANETRDRLFSQLDALAHLKSKAPRRQRSRYSWLAMSVAASVGLVVLTLTLPNPQSLNNLPTVSSAKLNNIVAEQQPLSVLQQLPKEQALSQEYKAILSDIEMLGERIGVN